MNGCPVPADGRDGREIGPTENHGKLCVSEPLTAESELSVGRSKIGRYVGLGLGEQVATGQADRDEDFGLGASICMVLAST